MRLEKLGNSLTMSENLIRDFFKFSGKFLGNWENRRNLIEKIPRIRKIFFKNSETFISEILTKSQRTREIFTETVENLLKFS